MPDLVILIVKASNQAVPDQRFECDFDQTVLELKNRLSKEHPGTPSVKDQRLIYLGQLLEDGSTLRTVLRHPPENNAYPLHLVYPSPIPNPIDEPKPTVSDSFPTTMDSEGVRRRTGTEALSNQVYNQDTYYRYLSEMPPHQGMVEPIQQMAAMQQMYSQYIASYMHYLQAGNAAVYQPLQGYPGVTPVNTLPNIPEIPQEPAVEPPQPNEPAPLNNPPVQVNNQGRVMMGDEDEEGGARDWLDYIYCFSRLAVLLSIVYFYSTMARFMMVVGTCLLVHLYQTGFFNINGDVVRAPGRQPEQPGAPPPEAPINAEAGQAPPDRPEPVREAPVANIQPSLLSLSLTFLVTFFTSLIPDAQQMAV